MQEQFGVDPMDAYSTPVEVRPSKLATILVLNERNLPSKPGRVVTVVWDERIPHVPGFRNRFSYVVRLESVGSKAGNHFHHRKEELFLALHGALAVILEDPATKEREEHRLQSGDQQMLYIPTGIAHVVVALTGDDSLLVVASHNLASDDEFPYLLV